LVDIPDGDVRTQQRMSEHSNAKDVGMSDTRETAVRTEREPSRAVHVEQRSSNAGMWIGIIVAVLVLAVIAFFLFRPAADTASTGTEVNIENNAPAPEQGTPPAAAPEASTPAPAPEASTPPAAAPAEPAVPAPAPTGSDATPPAGQADAPPPAPAPAPAPQ